MRPELNLKQPSTRDLMKFVEEVVFLRTRLEEVEGQRDEAVAALPDPDLLEMLAMWCDQHDVEGDIAGKEVQVDLREWASQSRSTLTKAAQWKEKDGK